MQSLYAHGSSNILVITSVDICSSAKLIIDVPILDCLVLDSAEVYLCCTMGFIQFSFDDVLWCAQLFSFCLQDMNLVLVGSIEKFAL